MPVPGFEAFFRWLDAKWRRLCREGRDALELVCVPALAAILPWPLCFKLFRWLCRFPFLHQAMAQEALQQARAYGVEIDDERAWLQRRRLVTVIDNADFYLSRTRSDAWMRRHLTVTGQWPEPGQAAVLCTFHWGAGMWALRHVGATGLNVHALMAPHTEAAFQGHAVQYHYYGGRNREIARALRTEMIPATGVMRPVLKALSQGDPVLAAVDVPADQAAASLFIPFLGRRVALPRGLFRLAVDARVPMYTFLTGISMDTGQRTLRIVPVVVGEDVQALMVQAFERLEQAIASDTAAWHFWSIAPRFFNGSSEAQPSEAAEMVDP